MWPLADPVNRLVSRLVETGMIDEFQRRARRQIQGVNYAMKMREPALRYAPVGMDELYFIFSVGAFGLGLGCLAFVGEILCSIICSLKRHKIRGF